MLSIGGALLLLIGRGLVVAALALFVAALALFVAALFAALRLGGGKNNSS